jgi:Tol biopolymer transport system component
MADGAGSAGGFGRVDVIATEAQTARPSRTPILAWGIAALGILAAGALAFVHFREKPAEAPLTRFSIAPQKGVLASLATLATPPAVSPDGRQVVFVAESEGKAQLWLRPFDALSAQALAGTEDGRFPFWSQDSKMIGFFAGGELKKMDLAGGVATVLADASNPRGATWNQDGVIVFAPDPNTGLKQISASGGASQSVTHVDTKKVVIQRFPRFLPDGRHFLYLAGNSSGQYTIRIGSLVATEEERELPGIVDSFAEFAQGRLVFLRGTTLVARPFDPQRLTFTGEAAPVADLVRLGQFNGDYLFSVSANGVLVYQGGVPNRELTWLDRVGKRIATLGSPGAMSTIRLSPDGKTVGAGARDSGANIDIWLFDILRGVRTRFTFDPAIDSAPLWSPDGGTIVFRSNRSGPGDLYRKLADGSKNEELLFADSLQKSPTSFSPGGKYLAYSGLGDPKTASDIWILPDPLGALGATKPYPFMRTDFNETLPQFSPNGHWIAYTSDESGRNEVYVAPFPGPIGKRQVSTAGGRQRVVLLCCGRA